MTRELTYNSIVKKVQREVLFADKMKMVAKRKYSVNTQDNDRVITNCALDA